MKKTVILFAVIGVVVLYGLSLFAQPELVALEDVKNLPGKYMRTEGVVAYKSSTALGNTVLRLKDGNDTLTVFLRGKTVIEVGDTISIEGVVRKYGEEYELLGDGRTLKVLKYWHEEALDLGRLASMVEHYRGLNVNVTGYAARVSSGGFYLVDNISGWHFCIKVRARTRVYLPLQGEKVYVKGLFDYEPALFGYAIKLCASGHEVGLLE
jgi:hypothetical protein